MTEEKKTAASQSEARPLTEQERQRRKKMIVYPLMVLIFLGSMWLIFAPTGDKEVKGGDQAAEKVHDQSEYDRSGT